MNTLKNLLSLNDDERLLAEVRTYQEKLISNAEEPIWERKWLTIEEAAAYSGIGRTKLRELSNQAGCPFAIWIGNKIHIVRERLDKYIDKQFRINRFGQAQHQATLNKAIRRIIRDCNDEQFLHSDEPDVLLPHFSCHSLRHTFTTRMCEAGVNIKVIQDALGHSDISTTLNIYADVTKEMKAEEFKGLDSYFKV